MVRFYSVGLKGMIRMIKFEKIKLSGYKNIDSANLILQKIISLLSNNNYGKSNLISGIDFGFDFINQNTAIRNRMMHYKSGFPLNKNLKSKKFKFEFEYSTVIDKIKYLINYGYEFSWTIGEKSKGKIVSEWLNIKDTTESQKYTAYLKRNGKVSMYKSSKTGSCDKEINIKDDELIINKLKAYDNLFYIEIINQINDIKIYIDRHFDSSDNYDISPFVWKNSFEEENIARLLFKIKNKNRSKYEKLINTYKELFPSINEIEVKCTTLGPDFKLENKLDGSEPFELTDKVYYLTAKDNNLSQVIPFDLMSDGAKRVLTILTYLVQADIENYSLIIIEEPENSVHPKLLQNYLISLNSLLENAKLIITSHSPYLINYIDPKKIYLGIPNNNGLAQFARIKETSINKIIREANEMDMLIGEYLFDLMSGTDEDAETLKDFMEI